MQEQSQISSAPVIETPIDGQSVIPPVGPKNPILKEKTTAFLLSIVALGVSVAFGGVLSVLAMITQNSANTLA